MLVFVFRLFSDCSQSLLRMLRYRLLQTLQPIYLAKLVQIKLPPLQLLQGKAFLLMNPPFRLRSQSV